MLALLYQVDEVGERRYITYDELMRNVNRAANFLLHHGVQKGDRVAISMSNSVEFIYFELALFLIGAVPILLNPGHVGESHDFCFKVKYMKSYFNYLLPDFSAFCDLFV